MQNKQNNLPRIKPDTRQHLKQFYLNGQAPPTVSYTNPKERKVATSLLWPVSPSPTTVSVVAPGPDFSRGRRTLSGTPRPDAQVHHTTGAAASPVRTSLDRPLAKPRAQDLFHRQDKTPSTDQQHRSPENQKNTGTLEGKKETGRLEDWKTPPKNLFSRSALSAFCSAGLRPSLRPVFGPASLRASTRSLSKGGVPSRSPSTPPRAGDGGVSFGSEPGNYSPKKRPPPFLTFDPRLGSHLPHTERGENRRESERGRI